MGELQLGNELGKVQTRSCMSDEQFGGAEGEHMSDEQLVGGAAKIRPIGESKGSPGRDSCYKSSVSCCCLMS